MGQGFRVTKESIPSSTFDVGGSYVDVSENMGLLSNLTQRIKNVKNPNSDKNDDFNHNNSDNDANNSHVQKYPKVIESSEKGPKRAERYELDPTSTNVNIKKIINNSENMKSKTGHDPHFMDLKTSFNLAELQKQLEKLNSYTSFFNFLKSAPHNSDVDGTSNDLMKKQRTIMSTTMAVDSLNEITGCGEFNTFKTILLEAVEGDRKNLHMALSEFQNVYRAKLQKFRRIITSDEKERLSINYEDYEDFVGNSPPDSSDARNDSVKDDKSITDKTKLEVRQVQLEATIRALLGRLEKV